jgi:hypothetical protein
VIAAQDLPPQEAATTTLTTRGASQSDSLTGNTLLVLDTKGRSEYLGAGSIDIETR